MLNEISLKYEACVDIQLEIMYLPIMKNENEIEDYRLICAVQEI